MIQKKVVSLCHQTLCIMTTKKLVFSFIMMAVVVCVMGACNNTQKEESTIHDTVIVYSAPDTDTTEAELQIPQNPPAPPVVHKKKEQPKPEVMYIAGHGTNGRVWGSITMKGDKGVGTVTDEHENALAVKCTRRGEELICYDQNSRQYIFKL